MTPSWIDAHDSEDTELGATYRTSIPLQGWSFGIASPDRINAALEAGKLVSGNRVKIVRTEIFAPGGVPDDWVRRGYRKGDWGVRVTWRKVKPGTPVLIYAAAIVAVLTAATLAWIVVGKFTEKELVEQEQHVGELAKSTLFNPGLIIAAVVVVALITRRK